MTLLGVPFEVAAYSFGWGNLRDFAMNLPPTSATFRALNSEVAEFVSPSRVPWMIADVYDAITALSYMFAKAHGAHGQKPQPYQRPGKANEGQRFGKDPIPIKDFDAWYYGGE